MWCVLVFAGFAVVVPRGGDAFFSFFVFVFVCFVVVFVSDASAAAVVV